MQNTIDETTRRRELQGNYNTTHGITPETIRKEVRAGIEAAADAHARANAAAGRKEEVEIVTKEYIQELETEMLTAAENLDFEKAAYLRDCIANLEDSVGEPLSVVEDKTTSRQHKKRRKKGGRVPRPKKQI